jgi:hypothetical protein
VIEKDKRGAGKSLESDMTVYQKWEYMAAYLYTALKSYPKSERFTLRGKYVNGVMGDWNSYNSGGVNS